VVKGLTLAGADSASVYSGPYAQWARRTPTAARALRCLRVSFHPDELNMTIGGWSHTALEKLYGCKIDAAFGVSSRNPADRSRRNNRLERIVREAVSSRRLVEMKLGIVSIICNGLCRFQKQVVR
jgi:hypothetical protein